MFDVDGTLVESVKHDDELYSYAVKSVLGVSVHDDWSQYRNVTDSGILQELIQDFGDAHEASRLTTEVKQEYLSLLRDSLERDERVLSQVPGAGALLQRLKLRDDLRVAIATGGWRESAELKLRHSGIPFEGVALASGDDSPIRTEIMLIAESRAIGEYRFARKVYFGDGEWDREACERIGYEFVAIGTKFEHEKQLRNFEQMEEVFECASL